MKKQNGFTLIELVVVIVILGILAVTAAPKFLNLQDDARVSAIKGLAGAMKGAAGITYGKAAIAGEELKDPGSVTIPSVDDGNGGHEVATKFGYPTKDSIKLVVDGLDTDWVELTSLPAGTPSGDVAFGFGDDFKCGAVYEEAQSATEPATVKVYGSVENCTLDATQ